MFERYLSDALTTYFGNFIENFDASKVRISAWKGELVLQDLIIRQNALDLLVGDCPVEIAYGRIGNLELSIPWKSVLRWSSSEGTTTSRTVECSVVLSDLHLLVTPKKTKRRRGTSGSHDNHEDELSLQEERVLKEQTVQRLLDAQLFERVAKSSTTVEQQSSSSRWQWVREFIKNLLSNLSVTVRNIHLRYEDAGMGFTGQQTRHVRESFAVGIMLRQFSVQTRGATVEREASPDHEDSSTIQSQETKDAHDKESEEINETLEQEVLPYSIRHKLAVASELAAYWDRGRGCHLMTANVYYEDDIMLLDSTDYLESRAEDQKYFASAFCVLSGEDCDDEFRHKHLYNGQHTFMLSPVSPSMEFALVSENEPADETHTGSKDPAPSNSALIPPSTMNMTCPPCCLTISANTLEDTAYLRKSLAIWTKTRKSSLSEASVRRLTDLRPSCSPLDDPQSWWKYAVEATLVLERLDSSQRKQWRPPGWVGLARAIRKRREYVDLYEKLLYSQYASERKEAHDVLINLEDELLVDEIVAFRLSVYSMITDPSRSVQTTLPEASGRLTWSEWARGKKTDTADFESARSETFIESEHIPLGDTGIQNLTLDHRRKMYVEMTEMIDREQSNKKRRDSPFRLDDVSDSSAALDNVSDANSVLWKTGITFKELSLQVDERIATKSCGYQLRPAIRLSCALIQEQTLYRDESWNVDNAIASLQVVDLTGDGPLASSGRAFPVLVGRKSGDGQSDDSTVVIDGVEYPLCASVSVRRTIERKSDSSEKGMDRDDMIRTTTHSVIRLLPLEVVYSTNPVAALARALSTVKTPELTDDFHRMASVMSQWRNKQKGRLLRALAHRRKKIVVDVDIAAPVVMIPEDTNDDDSPLLVVDLGRLRFSNADDSSIEDDAAYDDKWRLALDEIQVQCSSALSYPKRDRSSGAQKLVEPFSLHFVILTRIANEESRPDDGHGTIVNIHATLPRLIFNLKSSAVRLVERLKLQWVRRSRGNEASLASPGLQTNSRNRFGTTMHTYDSKQKASGSSMHPVETGSIGRRIKFCFSAPLIGLRLENDVDGRGCTRIPELSDTGNVSRTGDSFRPCPLVDLVFRDIRGEFVQRTSGEMDSTSTFDAWLRSITAVDLYQNAGEDFALLLSSLPPSEFPGRPTSILEDPAHSTAETFSEPESNDLVSVHCSSTVISKHIPSSTSMDVEKKDRLAITFHELYVEWNPETIAAIHKGMMLPRVVEEIESNETPVQYVSDPIPLVSGVEGKDSDDEFYDAVEATDTSIVEEDDNEMQLISEISSRVSSFSDQAEIAPLGRWNVGGTMNLSPFLYSGKAQSLLGSGISPLSIRDHLERSGMHGDLTVNTTTSFQVEFKLSALHVNFNKDSRRRRVLTAEMDDTDVLYMRQQSGRSTTKARIGNLSFADPSSTTNTTLYKDILGLKCDSFGKERATSLLEMELSMNPRIRRLVVPGEEFDDEGTALGVSVDCHNGTVHGADMSVSLRLSPMRFVYMQQLWLEIIDYFFEGIVGYEVWGKDRPSFDPELSTPAIRDNEQPDRPQCHSSVLRSNLPGLLADEFSFTRFDVRMDMPMVLIPVSYQSPHFLRLEFSSLTASNFYLGTAVGANTLDDKDTSVERVQWYNNCDLQLEGLKLTSWDGSEIHGSQSNVGSTSATNARIKVNWPVGKGALSVVPKWKVDCDVDCIILSLRRESYALLQHVIVHNIGELSRHLEEWNALQNLPPAELESHKKEIMVHFGYDKKDTAPSTYAVSVQVPSIEFILLGSSSASDDVVMEASCTNVEWQMKKLFDRMSRQLVTCDIALTKRVAGCEESGGVTNVDLLLPVGDAACGERRNGLNDVTSRALLYTSTTQPSGDNVRTLEIVDACIFGVYPAWTNVKNFFSNLPEPDFLEPDEVGLAMQIGDRWYRIGGDTEHSSNHNRRMVKEMTSFESKDVPSYQFRLLLKSPRIVLSSEWAAPEIACVVLRMSHFDFFHHNDARSRKVTKTFFVHDLGLYTSSVAVLSQGGYADENSLIRPWSITGQHERCDPRIFGSCDEHSLRVKADILQARAAYSDMSVALDVGLRLLADLEQVSECQTERRGEAGQVERGRCVEINEAVPESTIKKPCSVPRKRLLSLQLDGFELHVVDDSMRHFAGAQQLIKFSFNELSLYQVTGVNQGDQGARLKKMTKLRLRRIDVFDCLQPVSSPFRLVATSRQPTNATANQQPTYYEDLDMLMPRMSWSDFCTIEDSRWGFTVSTALTEGVQTRGLLDFCDADFASSRLKEEAAVQEDLSEYSHSDVVELRHLLVDGVSDEYAVNIRPVTMQWNPSTVIALQRFLGRLYKEGRKKSDREWPIPSASTSSGLISFTSSESVPTRARLRIDHLTVFLNKEHQRRCLVRVALSGGSILFENDTRSGMVMEGSVNDLGAWDNDTSMAKGPDVILEENRRILQVVTNDSKEGSAVNEYEFLRFRFRTFAGSGPLSPDLPSWVSSRMQDHESSNNAIDDILSVSMATIRLCYIRERTEEILDYLSNGLPGKGMGATSRAAKGFINKRIQTKSYLEVDIQAPQLYIPQHEKTYRGIMVHLGDVTARSWFEQEIGAQNNPSLQMIWYRILSLSLKGLRWNANTNKRRLDTLNGSVYAVPLDVNLSLRKPMKKGNAVVVKGNLTLIDLTLTYTTFVLLKAVMKDNVSRDIDVTRWDNVEKAYWMEEEDEGDHVAYSSNARFIRYGQERRAKIARAGGGTDFTVDGTQAAQEPPPSEPKLDCLFNFDGMRLKLYRDDPLEGLDSLSVKGSTLESAFYYDIVVLRADTIEVSFNANSSGDKSLQLTLDRLGLFDLGDRGRLARGSYYQDMMELDSLTENSVNINRQVARPRNPCAFSVLIEGYSPSDDHMGSSGERDRIEKEPQLLLTVDTCSSSSAGLTNEDYIPSKEDDGDKIILARMVFNYLSVNALIRPLREIVAFLSCAWPVNDDQSNHVDDNVYETTETSVTNVDGGKKPVSSRKGLQLKLVAHYPRIFFVADESDPCSRALVLRGLGVLDASIVDQETIVQLDTSSDQSRANKGLSCGFSDKKVVTTVNAQFHSMETYINPNVERALGFVVHNADAFDQNLVLVGNSHPRRDDSENIDSQLLGVALIQPVTAGIEYCQIKRERFPTLESFSVNMEPVSTMLSFEDLTLLEAILERWSSKTAKANSLSGEGSSSHLDLAHRSMSMVSQPSFEGSEVTGTDVETSSFDVNFETDRLGLVLKKISGAIVVERMQNTDIVSVQAGDVLTAINGAAVETFSLDEVVELLAASSRPVKVTFSRTMPIFPSICVTSSSFGISQSYSQSQEGSVADDSVDAVANETFSDDKRLPDVYTVTLRRGVLNGLTVEPSPSGGLPVVIDVLPSFFLDAISILDVENGSLEVENRLTVRLPRTGAVVAEVDGKPSSEIGYLETKKLLDSLSSKTTDADNIRLSFDKDAAFSVKFMEVDSSEWGKIKTADIAVAGVALTFIDDFKGRDMPLLRGKLDGIEVHVERGFGIDPRAVVAPPPNVLDLAENGVDSHDEVTMIRTVLQIEVDYYHPRIAVWEPLLEPSDLCFMVEWQQGSSRRPGQLALEVSDRFVESGEPLEDTSGLAMAPRVISINITDAAAEVVSRSIKEWKDWRQRAVERQPVDSQALNTLESRGDAESTPYQRGFPLSPTAKSESTFASTSIAPGKLDTSSSVREAKHVAAQKAAKAALVFAKKRGAGTKNISGSAKPFVFRNRTGMSLSFIQHASLHQENDHVSPAPKEDELDGRPVRRGGTTPVSLADGDDARFDMDIIRQERQLKDEGDNVKRVRAYDGQYPSLSVTLESMPGIALEPLRNLPVFKVGNTIRRLQARKLHSETATLPNSKGTESISNVQFSVPVVWTVEIEDNRRILTLSSAVRVISSGVRLSVDIGICISLDKSIDTASTAMAGSTVQQVGKAESGAPFYLPVWLALRCEEVDVFIKPSGLDYGWSKQSVLSFVPIQSLGIDSSTDHVNTDWAWKETFDSSCAVPCERSPSRGVSGSNTLWLSCVSLPHVGGKGHGRSGKRSRKSQSLRLDSEALISVAVDAGLTLRNLLPVNLQWELGAFDGSEMLPIESSFRREQHNDAGHLFVDENGLSSGEAVDVLSFTPGLPNSRARFRCHADQAWSEWAPLSQPVEKKLGQLRESGTRETIALEATESEYREDMSETQSARQVNVQIRDEFGLPITIGVRIVPKVSGTPDINPASCFGYDAIVFAELWLRNLTPLPLSFGCPSIQLTKAHIPESGENSSDDAGIVNAEAALLELASILELGERGKGFNLRDDNGSTITSDTCLIPYQTADLIFDEVFEYVEVENSVIKRRWWASEMYDSRRQDPHRCEESKHDGWHWIDDEWKIDCSGQSLRSSDGWESCRSLIGGKEDYFSRRRTFNSAHPFRRRRWFRRRRASYRNAAKDEGLLPGQLYEGINAFHQPINDAFSRAQARAREMRNKRERKTDNDGHTYVDEEFTKISIRCAGGQWSAPCVVPQTGGAHGIIKVPATRWPTLTKLSNQKAAELTPAMNSLDTSGILSCASLSPALYELCYKVADLGDDWGEFTRMFFLTPRFMMRNDSLSLSVEIKQSGAPDESAVLVEPGDVVPFFWADFRLPELVSLRPVLDDHNGYRKYRWSGGFDVCTLGMTAIRLRRSRLSSASKGDSTSLKSIRTLVEIRSGTGGTGINVSFKEENPSGNGSLFRIENLSPFLIWIAQDGVLANPSSSTNASAQPERRFLDDHARTDGDLVEPGDCTAFALDVPFRQGKYAGRKAASMSELTRVRVGLAPLSSRDGVESTKVVSLSVVGETVKLSPAKLSSIGGFDIRTHLVDLRVLGVVTTDGPTRVLRFCMMRKDDASGVFDYTLSNISSAGPFRNPSVGGYTSKVKIASRGKEEYLQQVTLDSAMRAIEMDPPKEDEALRLAFFGHVPDVENNLDSSRVNDANAVQDDTIFSFRASFYGFSCSLIDMVPSEIALVTLKDVDASASWSRNRTTEATAVVSVGWLQVDNFVPSAPFPVAVCPVRQDRGRMKTVDENREDRDLLDDEKSSPLLLVGLTFAPKHKSGILCLRSATIAPRDMAVSVDLAFVVRLQQFFVGVHRHLRAAFIKNSMADRANSSLLLLQTETRDSIPFPDIESMIQHLEGANAVGVGSQKLYFQGLTILPCNVNLSVAPARALTSSQASLEGSEAAALHAAVRKGDLLVGGGMLGVNIGHKNQTAAAVVRGVFKSIIVDALLRCEAASLNFSGVYLRNHISTGPQLKTFLGAHYMESLKSNVPALLGSMAALGNPLGLIRGIGDGMSDFVNEPVKGLKKSMQELDPSYVVGGVARGTKSLARHAVGGFAGSASLLTETFSKNMAVITLDRRYAQRRDRRNTLRSPDRDFAVTFFEGVESGAVKLVRGVWDGVTGVVRAPIRGAERHGMEGFAKGVGKGLLGLLVKPVIGLSDAATDVMIGVQGSVEGKSSLVRGSRHSQVRPRRPLYGRDRIVRPYVVADAAAATLMLRTKLAGENYLSHYDMGDKVALLSVKRVLLLGPNGENLLIVKYKNIEKVSVHPLTQRGDGVEEWAVVIVENRPGSKERPVQVIKCSTKTAAEELCSQVDRGISLVNES